MKSHIGFNKPYFTGRETEYIEQAVKAGKISGDGLFTGKCHDFFQRRYGFRKVFLTTSCTDALEMCSLLLNIQPGDEVIVPSFTFVSTANAFVLRGANIIFADSESETPNLDPASLEQLITPRTKAIVAVHYAGMACDMDRIVSIARRHNVTLIEDAAQAIDSFYKGRPLGSIGDLATFSFHESKNIISGEGGMLVVNDPEFIPRAEIVREKGTNRSAHFRGEVDKYTWLDVGSSFLPSDVIAAILFAQLEHLDEIQAKRISIWNSYREKLIPIADKGLFMLPSIPEYATNNGHMFYVLCSDLGDRTALIEWLSRENINAVFHYVPLHTSPFYAGNHKALTLQNCERFSDRLLRLPLYFELTESDIMRIVDSIKRFYDRKNHRVY
jgi:dTDP-4-amino-4,6-dideoxygalactose transaminase